MEIEQCKPRTILEIGTWNGKQAAKMINTAARFNPKDDIVYYGFDLFEKLEANIREQEYCNKAPCSYKEASFNISVTGVEFHLYQGNTKETLPKFRPEFPIDFVWIDGGHSIDTIRSDWKEIEKIIHKESVVLFDDYYPGNKSIGAFEVVDEIIDTDKYDVELLKPIDTDVNGLSIQIVKVSMIP